MIRVVSIGNIVFFGFLLLYIVNRIFTTKPALVLSQKGITNNTNASGGQLIKWEDILSMETGTLKGSHFLLVYVKNPKEYIGNAPFLKKILMKLNEKSYGTPLSITTQGLKVKYEILVSDIQEWYLKFGAKNE